MSNSKEMAVPSEKATQQTACPVCAGADTIPLVDMPGMPVLCNELWDTQEGARHAPRGDIRPTLCRTCSHIFNSAFDPDAIHYAQSYENSLHFSPRFQQYAQALVSRLVSTYDLRHKTVLEIGCGQGEFLSMLCAAGDNQGIGFDPSYSPERAAAASTSQITFVPELYSEKTAHYAADLICCRHVLEHIQHPRAFVTSLRRALADSPHTVVYMEVPNVRFMLEDLSIWDFIYEHYSYFSARSLARLFHEGGFRVLRLEEAYRGQFLALDAMPGPAPADAPAQERVPHANAGEPDAFAQVFQQKIQEWKDRLATFAQEGKRVAIWGAGSKGVTFLNLLQTAAPIDTVTDINPHKQGKFIAGTGHQITAPDYLVERRPDVVIIMNPIYRPEIEQQLANWGLNPQVLSV
jgi:SAM-dependent methyltransferase